MIVCIFNIRIIKSISFKFIRFYSPFADQYLSVLAAQRIVTAHCIIDDFSCSVKCKLRYAPCHTDPTIGMTHFHKVSKSNTLLTNPEKKVWILCWHRCSITTTGALESDVLCNDWPAHSSSGT